MPRDPGGEDPFFWFGPGWRAGAPLGIADLIRDGTVDTATAALLWDLLARHRSLTVIAGPSGVGKTTLLTALLDFLPAATRRIYIRGGYETFAFMRDTGIDAARTSLLVNEMSPHLPVYLWGPGIERLLGAAERGFQVLATAHGDSVAEFVASLARAPLRVPAARIAGLGHVALIEPTTGGSGRRVRGVWRLDATRDGMIVEQLTSPQDISPEASRPPSDTAAPGSDLHERERLLSDLLQGNRASLPELAVRQQSPETEGAP